MIRFTEAQGPAYVFIEISALYVVTKNATQLTVEGKVTEEVVQHPPGKCLLQRLRFAVWTKVSKKQHLECAKIIEPQSARSAVK